MTGTVTSQPQQQRFIPPTNRPLHLNRFYSYLVYIISALLVMVASNEQSRAWAQPVRLSQAIASAVERNPSVQQSEARVKSLHGRKLQAAALPPLTVSYHEEDIPNGSGPGSGGQKIYTLSQDFDLPGLFGLRARLYGDLTEAGVTAASFAKRAAKAEAVAAYSELYARERQVLLLRLAVDVARRAAEHAKRRYEAGETAALESMQSAAAAALAVQAYRESEMRKSDASLRLAAAMGIPVTDLLETADSLSGFTDSPAIPNPDALLDAHPAVQIARMMMEGYEFDSNWRWMEYLPGFSVSAFRQEYQALGNFWGVEFGINVPVWFFLSPRGSTEEAEGNALEAQASYRAVTAETSSRIRRAIAVYLHAEAALREYRSSLLAEANELQRVAELGFQIGDLTYLEYASAMERSLSIQMGYYDSLMKYFEAAGTLELETGIELPWN